MVDQRRPVDVLALVVGGIRLLSGLSFVVAPVKANRAWGDDEALSPTAQLLLRSMGYRDALIGGGLLAAATKGTPRDGWFLASAGADAVDLIGGLGRHKEMPRQQVVRGLGGAALGVTLGVLGAVRARRR